jgi:hypothetical protein
MADLVNLAIRHPDDKRLERLASQETPDRVGIQWGLLASGHVYT